MLTIIASEGNDFLKSLRLKERLQNKLVEYFNKGCVKIL